MRSLALLTLVLAGFVSACGYRGNLERPPPMWGREATPAEPQKEEPLTREDPTEDPSERRDSPT